MESLLSVVHPNYHLLPGSRVTYSQSLDIIADELDPVSLELVSKALDVSKHSGPKLTCE